MPFRRDIGDPDVLDELVDETGLPANEVRALVERGEGDGAVSASMVRARDDGLAATPAWLFGEDGERARPARRAAARALRTDCPPSPSPGGGFPTGLGTVTGM